MSNCIAILSLTGAAYRCDLSSPHPGIAHRSVEADAAWCSSGEARSAKGVKVKIEA